MKALVTGASSGMGRDMAIYLSELGYDLVLVSRDEDKLESVKKLIKTNSEIIVCDLSNIEEVKKLYVLNKNNDIDVLINCAGFGDFGYFTETDINKELNMINTNVIAVHLLTKLFLKEMVKKDSGYIMNVASSAAFGPGPLMSTYYATKAYVNNLTEGINEELRRKKSNVFICSLCPGPVDTNFNNVANVKFSLDGLNSKDVSRYAIDKMFKKKVVIVPGFLMKLALFGRRFASRRFIRKISFNIQSKKDSR